MSHSNLTRWIEDADARHVYQAVQPGRSWAIAGSHHPHDGKTAAQRLPEPSSRTYRHPLSALRACALTFARHSPTRNAA